MKTDHPLLLVVRAKTRVSKGIQQLALDICGWLLREGIRGLGSLQPLHIGIQAVVKRPHGVGEGSRPPPTLMFWPFSSPTP